MLKRLLPILVLSLFLAPPPATARAQADDGVQVDPDSAPAKEYALPLQDARGAATGSAAGGTSGETGAGAPPAFGSGITAKKAQDSSPSGAGARGRSGGRRPSAEHEQVGHAKTGAATRSAPAGIGEGDGVAAAYSAGGAAIVLLAGGLVALTLRRRRPSA